MGIESTGFLSGSQISADKVDGFDASQTIPTAGTIPVSDASGNLSIDILANGSISNGKLADNSIYGNKIKNVLRGVLPVASGWDVDPTNLANCTDGNKATVTGQGSKNMVGAGYYGQVVLNMGSVKTVIFSAIIGIWSAANAVVAHVSVSDDNVSYSGAVSITDSNTTAAEVVRHSNATIVTGQYIKLQFYVSGAANTANAKIYELMAYEVAL